MASFDLDAVAREILKVSPFEQTEVQVTSWRKKLTRYGDNKITQNVDQEVTSASVRVVDKKRTVRADFDQLDSKSIQKSFSELKGLLGVLPDAAEIVPVYAKGDHYSDPKRKLPEAPSADAAAQAISKATEAAKKQKLEASGVFSVEQRSSVYANSAGLFLTDNSSDSEFSCTLEGTAQGKGGAGRGFSNLPDPARHPIQGVIDRAFEKCVQSADPTNIEPGHYDVILEPAAAAELLVFFGWLTLSAKAYAENRSFARGKLGEKIFQDKITLSDDPLNPVLSGAWFDGQGVAKSKTVFVENGILKNLAHDLKTAAKFKVKSTGHGVPEPNTSDPLPWNLGMEWSGPQASQQEMIAATKKGILVTQFHYTNVLDLMAPSVTGMTRNGTFLIENGKIVKPIRNMRFTQNLIDFFNGIESVSPTTERVTTFFDGASLAPTLRVRNFHFSSGTGF